VEGLHSSACPQQKKLTSSANLRSFIVFFLSLRFAWLCRSSQRHAWRNCNNSDRLAVEALELRVLHARRIRNLLSFHLVIPNSSDARKRIDSRCLRPDTDFRDVIVTGDPNLSLQDGQNGRSIVVLGEVLWDQFEGFRRLGGAPLNFAAHAGRLGYRPSLISAVGTDALGEEAASSIAALDVDTTFLQTTSRFPTGRARVELGPGGRTRFVIERPAAYDATQLSSRELERLIRLAPAWLYYGTLFSSTSEGKSVLSRLLDAFPAAVRFYDLNLPNCDSTSLVRELLAHAQVVKLNEHELLRVQECTGLPSETEPFCREGAERYGWQAVCITLGARGCAMLAHGRYAEAEGIRVKVADPVGAGDAFAAAFMHGLISRWPVAQIAEFANRVGALVAARPGAIPEWSVKELVNYEDPPGVRRPQAL